MNRTRIVVADPLRIFRTGVANLLARESDFEVVEVGSLVELAEAIGPGDRCPDLALIDVDLPPLGGVGAVRELARRCNTHMILWSLRPSRDEVLDGIRAGAHGFLHKEISGAGLMRALRGAVQGEAPLARDLATLMIDALHGVEERTEALERASVLSSRERQVLDLIAGGARNR
ncbi:MAG: response regulator, partial [Gaiellaceae bacterium]